MNTVLAVNEGAAATISKQSYPSGLDVEWTIEDPTVATVDENGVVTGKKAGVTKVTATAFGADPQECTVYVTIADGVYRIKNVGSQCYLDACGANISQENLTNIRQRTSISTGNDRLAQMWKIKYLGGGYYSIRPMHKLDMGLNADTSDVNLIEIGTVDSTVNVTANARWTITFHTNGYVFKRGGSNARTLSPYANLTSENAMIVAAAYSANEATHRWTLQKLTSVPEGVLIYDMATGTLIAEPIRVGLGQTRPFFDLEIEAAVYSPNTINQTVIWQTVQSGPVSVNENTGTITGNALTGVNQSVTITANSRYCSASGSYQVQCLDVEYFGFKNFYDSVTFGYGTTNVYANYIQDAVRFVKETYGDQFGVIFYMPNEPAINTIYNLRQCDPNVPCNSNNGCSKNCSQHHKNVGVISNAFLSESVRAYNEISVLWMDFEENVFCDLDPEHSVFTNTLAVVYKNRPVIQIMKVSGNNIDEKKACMAITLAHETAHCFCLSDAEGYESKTHQESSYNNGGCVMDQFGSPDDAKDFYNAILEEDQNAFCEKCCDFLQTQMNEDSLNNYG